MRAVAQRVRRAEVRVDGEVVGKIEGGLLVYLGVGDGDDEKSAETMAKKLIGLRIFEDEEGKMSRSVEDTGGSMLIVSQFTLFGDVRKGRRPSFGGAAPPEEANRLYEYVAAKVQERLPVATGRFRAMMEVDANVWGPVTILIDTEKTF